MAESKTYPTWWRSYKGHSILRAEKLTSLGQMAASIAHELNNPLAGVLVYTKLLAKKVTGDTFKKEEALDQLSKMASEVSRCSLCKVMGVPSPELMPEEGKIRVC